MDEIQQLTNEQVVAKARKAFASGRTKSLSFRRAQLENMSKMLEECCDEFIDALQKDLRKCRLEAMLYEIDMTKAAIKVMLRNLKSYAAREYLPISLAVFTDRAYIEREPFGVVMILGPWNYPVCLSLMPAIGAIASGNVVILKPSECTAHSAELIFRKFAKYMDQECYQVVLGDVERTKDLLTHKMDYIYCTGSTSTGRSVYLSAAQHLTPCTLELGGKSPCYIDVSADMYLATKRILWGKYINLGQTCIAPDYILCSKSTEKQFIEIAKEVLVEYFGKKWSEHPDVSRIMNKRNFLRLKTMLDSTKGRIVYGGKSDEDDLWIEPTIVVDVEVTDSLMKEEIFGPIIPIVTVRNVNEAIKIISKGPKPLALYTFSKDDEVNQKLISNCSSGGGCINDVMYHSVWQGLPFGGVGESGMGSFSIGKIAFDTFSNKKSILARGFSWISEKLTKSRYPPYTEKKVRAYRVLNNYFQLANINFNHVFTLIGALIVYQNTSDNLATLAGATIAYLCSKDTVTALVAASFFIYQFSGLMLTCLIGMITAYLFIFFLE